MRLMSTRFGAIEVFEDDVIHFRHGILGFEQYRDYALIKQDSSNPFNFLQSVDDPDLTFVITDPLWLRPDYRVRVHEEDLEKLDVQKDDDVAVYAIVTVPKDPKEMTVNLLAPILVNRRNRQAMQHVQSDVPYQIRHRVRDELDRRQRLEQGREREAGPVSQAGQAGQVLEVGSARHAGHAGEAGQVRQAGAVGQARQAGQAGKAEQEPVVPLQRVV